MALPTHHRRRCSLDRSLWAGRIVDPMVHDHQERGASSKPIRAGTTDANGGLAFAGLLALALVPLGQVVLAVGVAGSVIAVAVAAAGIVTGNRAAVRLTTLALTLGLAGLIGLPFAIWFAVAVMWLAGRALPHVAPAQGWLPHGRSSPLMWWLTGTTVVLAGAGLTAWVMLASDPAQATTQQLVELGRELPWWAIALFVVIFVPVNALTEEIAYRGIAFESATATLPAAPAIVAQAFAFGTLHVAGFPAGIAGVGLAFGYGVMLGVMRDISGGLLFPIIAHMAADAAIAVLVIVLLLPT
jgi:membrane protease YdiL (CAAX protease family)